jgi:hypothetical protein
MLFVILNRLPAINDKGSGRLSESLIQKVADSVYCYCLPIVFYTIARIIDMEHQWLRILLEWRVGNSAYCWVAGSRWLRVSTIQGFTDSLMHHRYGELILQKLISIQMTNTQWSRNRPREQRMAPWTLWGAQSYTICSRIEQGSLQALTCVKEVLGLYQHISFRLHICAPHEAYWYSNVYRQGTYEEEKLLYRILGSKSPMWFVGTDVEAAGGV